MTNSDYREMIKILRDEANEYKDCFNRLCFQSLAIISALYVLIIRFMSTENILVGFGSYLVLIIIGTVVVNIFTISWCNYKE